MHYIHTYHCRRNHYRNNSRGARFCNVTRKGWVDGIHEQRGLVTIGVDSDRSRERGLVQHGYPVLNGRRLRTPRRATSATWPPLDASQHETCIQVFLLILSLSLLFNSKKPRKSSSPYPSPRVALGGLMASSPVSEPQPTPQNAVNYMVFAQFPPSLPSKPPLTAFRNATKAYVFAPSSSPQPNVPKYCKNQWCFTQFPPSLSSKPPARPPA